MIEKLKHTVISTVILFCILFSSCNSESEDLNISSSSSVTEKSSSTTYDALSQLEGIPVYIALPDNAAPVKYLATFNDKTWSCIWYNDDNSGRQKWYIKKLTSKIGEYNTYSISGQSGAYKNYQNLVPVTWSSDNVYHPEISPNINNNKWIIKKINDDNLFKIIGNPHLWYNEKNNPQKGYFLSCIGKIENYGMGVELRKEGYTNLQNWVISPAEEVEIVGIEYVMEAGDIINKLPDFVTTAYVNNNTSMTQSMTMTFSNKVTEQSNFSKTEGITVNASGSLKIGIPLIADLTLGGSGTSNKSWTYGNSETKEDSRTYSFPVIVAARKSVKAVASVQRYQASVTYNITYKGRKTGKTFTLKGKWSGIKASTITYTLSETNSGVFIKSFPISNKNVPIEINKIL